MSDFGLNHGSHRSSAEQNAHDAQIAAVYALAEKFKVGISLYGNHPRPRATASPG
jgi:hypothetical protein